MAKRKLAYLKFTDVTTLHDQKQKRIVNMSKVINAVTIHEKMNQLKTTCSLMLAKEDPIADVPDKDGSLLVLAEPFYPYMEYSREENQLKHI